MRKPERRPKAVGIYKRDRFKVNVWGAISSRGAVKFVVILFKTFILIEFLCQIKILSCWNFLKFKNFTHNMFATTYRHIIKHHLAPFIRITYGNEKCFLIQDNDGKHASDICIDELKKQNIHWVKKNLNIFSIFLNNFYLLLLILKLSFERLHIRPI